MPAGWAVAVASNSCSSSTAWSWSDTGVGGGGVVRGRAPGCRSCRRGRRSCRPDRWAWQLGTLRDALDRLDALHQEWQQTRAGLPLTAGTDAFTWTLNVPKDGTYTAYVKYPEVTGAATTAKYTLTHGTTTEPSVTKDQTANPRTWVQLGSYSLKQGEDTELKLDQNSGGVAVADAVKLVRDTSGETDDEKKTFAYAYDVNGNLTSIDDTSSGARIDAYSVAYTGLNQVQKVTEALAGQEKKATSYTYDANGQPETVTHPDQFSRYTYDLRELVKTVSVGKSATDADPKVTSYTYTDRGQKLKETKANGNTVDYTYYLDGSLKTSVENKGNGTLVASHTYAYDANGNKAQDVAEKMNADNHTAYLSSTTDYTYDPADRLRESVKTGNGAATETYVHDDNANVIRQTVKGKETVYGYDRNRLLTASTGGVTADYNYDPFGRQESVTSDGEIVERSVYDGFDHVVESQKMDDTGALKSTKYTFDPLDRTASKTTDGKTTDFAYLGLSTEVLDEKVAGELTKSYQYSPWGERLSQVKHNGDGTTEDGYYGYNSHTDVETLTDDTGNTKATYGYTAYGADDDSEFTGVDKPSATDPTKEAYNPYRYNAKRWDAHSGTYDMGFRNYDPGLNRFTTRDMYNGALADMGLGTDLMTGNRYAFGGGNPSTFIEYDGHRPVECNESGYSCRMNSAGGWDIDYVEPSVDLDPAPGTDSYGGSEADAQKLSSQTVAWGLAYAKKYGVDEQLVVALLMQEQPFYTTWPEGLDEMAKWGVSTGGAWTARLIDRDPSSGSVQMKAATARQTLIDAGYDEFEGTSLDAIRHALNVNEEFAVSVAVLKLKVDTTRGSNAKQAYLGYSLSDDEAARLRVPGDNLAQSSSIISRRSARFDANMAYLSGTGQSMSDLFGLSSLPATQYGDPGGFCSNVVRNCG